MTVSVINLKCLLCEKAQSGAVEASARSGFIPQRSMEHNHGPQLGNAQTDVDCKCLVNDGSVWDPSRTVEITGVSGFSGAPVQNIETRPAIGGHLQPTTTPDGHLYAPKRGTGFDASPRGIVQWLAIRPMYGRWLVLAVSVATTTSTGFFR